MTNGIKIINAIQKLKINPFKLEREGNGRDGQIIEFTFLKGTSAVTLCWWTCDTPEEWESFENLVNELLSLEKSIDYIEEKKSIFTSLSDCFNEDKSLIIEIFLEKD